MADAAKTSTHSIKNTGQGPRYVHTVNGAVTLQPREERTLELAAGDLANAKDHPDLTLSAAKGEAPPRREAKGKAAKDAKAALEGTEDAGGAAARAKAEADRIAAGGDPNAALVPTSVRKAGFGKYQAFNADDQPVGKLIANRDEASKFAAEHKLEIEA